MNNLYNLNHAAIQIKDKATKEWDLLLNVTDPEDMGYHTGRVESYMDMHKIITNMIANNEKTDKPSDYHLRLTVDEFHSLRKALQDYVDVGDPFCYTKADRDFAEKFLDRMMFFLSEGL